MKMTRTIAAAGLLLAGGCASAPRALPPGVLVPLAPPRRPVEQLVASLHSEDSMTRALAAWELAGLVAPGEEIRKALLVAFEDPIQKVREAAAWALGHTGTGDDPSASGESLYDEAPRPLRITRPTYPRAAFEKRVEGTVELDILISEEGRVVHADVRRSFPELDQAAVDTVRGWTFEPARRNGKPVPAFASAPVTFRIF